MRSIRSIRGPGLDGLRFGRIGSLACTALVVAACSSSSSQATSTGSTGSTIGASPSPAVVITTTQSTLGTILTAENGNTVYLFEKDTGPKSTCYEACATGWPPVTVAAGASPSTSGAANSALLGTTTRTDGSTQLTYAGHPLYFFSADTAPGQTNGEEVNAFGAKWYVLSPAGKKVESD